MFRNVGLYLKQIGVNDLVISLIVPDWLKVFEMRDWLGTHKGNSGGVYLVLCFDWLNVAMCIVCNMLAYVGD